MIRYKCKGGKFDIKDKTEKITGQIRKINDLIHLKHHEIAQQNNLTLDQFHLLIHLKSNGKLPTVGQLAEKANKAQNTISERISRLEEKGLVERIKDENDRRISRVRLTEKGQNMIDSIRYQARNEFIFNALIKMESNTVEGLIRGLKELLEHLDH